MFLTHKYTRVHAHTQGWEETFGDDGYVYGIDLLMVSWVYTYIQIHQIVYIKHVQLFIFQSYLNKMV